MRFTKTARSSGNYVLIAIPVIAIGVLLFYNYTARKNAGPQTITPKPITTTGTPQPNNNKIPKVSTTAVAHHTAAPVGPVHQYSASIRSRKYNVPLVAGKRNVIVAEDTLADQNMNNSEEINKAASNNASLLDSFYHAIARQPVTFQIDPQRDTTLNLPEGTTIRIPANALAQTDLRPAQGEITFSATEFYDKLSMVCNRLSTSSNGEILLTGGMLKLTAKDTTGTELTVKKGMSLNVQMPYKERDKEMELFVPAAQKNTLPNKNGTKGRYKPLFINWTAGGQVQGYAPEPMVHTIDWTASSPRAPWVYFNENNRLIFFISNECLLSKAEIRKKLQEQYPGYKITIRRQWKHPLPFLQTGDEVSAKKTVMTLARAKRYKLVTPEEEAAAIQQFKIDLKRKSSEAVQQSAMAQLESKYSFNVSGLGYINCDRFYRNPRPKVYYTIANTDTTETVYNHCLIFHSIGAIMNASWDISNLFQNIPTGEKVTLVSVCVRNNQTVAYFKTFTTESSATITPEYQPTTPAEYRNKIQNILADN